MTGSNENVQIIDLPSGDFDSEVTMIHDRDELRELLELERLRKRTRRSVPNQPSASPSEEPW